MAFSVLLVAPLAILVGRDQQRRAAATVPDASGIPAVYMPIYATAERAFKVNRWLLASIHKQESDFSRLRLSSLSGDAVSRGWNGCGAAGPVQMGIVGVAPYFATTAGGCSAGNTWAAYSRAFRRAADMRPSTYPQRRDALGSCVHVPRSVGCVYDDFDAIMGAAMKLSGDGADMDLSSIGTYRAVCAYIGTCQAVEAYYGVIPRAKQWEADARAAAERGSGADEVSGRGLIWPVRGPVVSPYGVRWGRQHEGIDIAAPIGTPILAAGAGTVVVRSWFGGYGNFTCVRHRPRLTTCYGHQQAASVRLGQRVGRGQRIGTVGCTGHCFGPHVHFEVHLAPTWSNHTGDVDPMPFLTG